jgi:hypothetical protein
MDYQMPIPKKLRTGQFFGLRAEQKKGDQHELS